MLKGSARKSARWLICLLPLFFAGCFESQSAAEKPKQGKIFGVAALSRFFPSAQVLSNKSSETPPAAESIWFVSGSSLAYTSAIDDIEEVDVAIPHFIGNSRVASSGFAAGGSPPTAPGTRTQRDQVSNLAVLASVIFDNPFNRIFSPSFPSSQDDDGFPNPFTEARQRQAVQAIQSASDTPAEAPEPDKAKTDKTERKANSEPSKAESANSANSASGAGIPPGDLFAILGDFNGSGLLGVMTARRSSDTKFTTDRGDFDLDLFINPSAARERRSFYIDDINGDLVPDLLVTSHVALFGGVLLGNGAGGFQLVDKFLTGFQPTVPSAGPYAGSLRDIVTIDTSTGDLKTFHATDRYRQSQREYLPFAPNYVLHLEAQDHSGDFLMAAQIKGTHQILRWLDGSSLEATAGRLPADPLIFSGDFGTDSIQIYQVGSFASVVLTSQGETFNVANLRVWPGVILVVGNLLREGNTDLAVGTLTSFVPARAATR